MANNRSFSAAQWARIRRSGKAPPSDPSVGGELNIVPLLDIVMNVMLFVLATVTTVFTATIAVPAPSRPADSAGRAGQGTVLELTREGFIVGTDRGYLQPDCTSLGGPAIVVPAVRGAHDFHALSQCLLRARSSPSISAALRASEPIRVAGHAAAPYALMVRMLDAARESRPGARDLFVHAQLGLL